MENAIIENFFFQIRIKTRSCVIRLLYIIITSLQYYNDIHYYFFFSRVYYIQSMDLLLLYYLFNYSCFTFAFICKGVYLLSVVPSLVVLLSVVPSIVVLLSVVPSIVVLLSYINCLISLWKTENYFCWFIFLFKHNFSAWILYLLTSIVC